MKVFAQRYALDVQVASVGGAALWRAQDRSLKRWVSILLLGVDDPRSPELIRLTTIAAQNDRRDSVAILDVFPAETIESPSGSIIGPYVGIVSEWVAGETLDRRMIRTGEAATVADSLRYTGALAESLEFAHKMGIFHGRIRPHSFVFSETDEVRISGFGVDRVLFGADSGAPVQNDISNLGKLLFTLLTGVWPDGPVDGLPGAPKSEAGIVPSQLRSGITPLIDDIYLKSQSGQFASMEAFRLALTGNTAPRRTLSEIAIPILETPRVTWLGNAGTKDSRLRAVGIASASVLVFAWIGWQLLTRNFHTSDQPLAIVLNPVTTASASPTPSKSAEPADILSAIDFDPFGDNTENGDMAPNVLDDDATTAWKTVIYRSAISAGKPGVGLLLDLGASRPVSEVDLSFLTEGTSVTVFVSDSETPDIETDTALGSVAVAGLDAVIKSPRAISGQYVLIWVTDVPVLPSGGFQGGITEVIVKL